MRICPQCKKDYVPLLVARESKEDIEKWHKGECIQNVFPDATRTEREQMISGICSDNCWDNYIGVEEIL